MLSNINICNLLLKYHIIFVLPYDNLCLYYKLLDIYILLNIFVVNLNAPNINPFRINY